MGRLIEHFFSTNSMIAFFMLIYVVIIIMIKNKIANKYFKAFYYIPLMVSLFHFLHFFPPINSLLMMFIPIYLYGVLIFILKFINKNKISRIYCIFLILFGIFSHFYVFYNTILAENIHVYSKYSYTDSFKKTIKNLEKEYVLNDHKRINYNFLYETYYPLIEKAEIEKDEQLYFKTMFEFVSNFKDGHFHMGFLDNDIDTIAEKLAFLGDYNNRDYGFASIKLSDGSIVAILVDENSDAYIAGLRDGMIITKKNGVEINKVLDKTILPLLNQYPVLEDEQFFKSFYLFATGEEKISLSFIDENEEEKNISIKSIKDYNEKCDNLLWKFLYWDTSLNNYDTKMLDNDTGYIYIDSESLNRFKGAIGYLTDDSSYYIKKMLLNKLNDLTEKGMKDLVIDLRSNTGGYMTESEAIAQVFTNDSFLVSTEYKKNKLFSDKSYLNGTGEYSNIKITVLVNSDTASAGDALTYLLSRNPNVKIVGFTNSNNSCQSVGGLILLDGNMYIGYPIYKNLDSSNNIFIDTDNTGLANVKLDERIELNVESVKDIVYTNDDYDWLLEYVKNNY